MYIGTRVGKGSKSSRRQHAGLIVRGLYDGDYDKTNLPKELVLSNYFQVRDGKIVSLIIIFNKTSPF